MYESPTVRTTPLTPKARPIAQSQLGPQLGSLPQPNPDRHIDDALKCVGDLILTSIGLVLLSPVLLVLWLIVKRDSPGPVIHRRRVMGVGGTQFDAFKFRTMHVNGDEILAQYPDLKAIWERDQKLKDDPRITKSGGWLRKLSLDELPQLFNVLLGQMSLVGPRMITKGELSRYGDYAEELLTVRPGLTGLWQISGRSDITGPERAQLDIYQIRTRSFLRDLKVLLLTFPAVIKGRGAY
jgi:lipopolysaccharide/colanic/teichoic acid biosynthesis glycosyltransferase